MKPSEEPEVQVSDGNEEIDAGWDEVKPSVTRAKAQPRSVPAAEAQPLADLDEGWDDDDDAPDDAEEPGVVAAKSAVDHTKPVPPRQPASGVVHRALSKKERRALERKNRNHATQKSSERKQSQRATRREEARRLAEQRQAERLQALAAAKKQRKQEQRRAEKRRPERVAETESEPLPATKPGTKSHAGKSARNKGRPKKQTGGGWIVAVIALITLGTAIFAWSRR